MAKRWMNSAFLANTNSKLNTEMTSTTDTAFYKEPNHDEIALSAFLAWKKMEARMALTSIIGSKPSACCALNGRS